MQQTYSQIRDQLETGDIVLFSSKGFISGAIRLMTRSCWSHVGMVVRMPEWDTIMIWEATNTLRGKDFFAKAPKKGVQLVRLSERIHDAIHNQGAKVAVRHLHDIDRDDAMRETLKKLRHALKNKDYETNLLELFNSAFDGVIAENEEDLSSIFCSELVAEAWQEIGILSEEKSSNEYVPKDFSSEGVMTLLKGYLTPQIELIA